MTDVNSRRWVSLLVGICKEDTLTHISVTSSRKVITETNENPFMSTKRTEPLTVVIQNHRCNSHWSAYEYRRLNCTKRDRTHLYRVEYDIDVSTTWRWFSAVPLTALFPLRPMHPFLLSRSRGPIRVGSAIDYLVSVKHPGLSGLSSGRQKWE